MFPLCDFELCCAPHSTPNNVERFWNDSGCVMLIFDHPTHPALGREWTQVIFSSIVVSSSLTCVMFLFVSQGKFIRINFDASGFIAGANVESCIL